MSWPRALFSKQNSAAGAVSSSMAERQGSRPALNPALRETLRAYWRWLKPRTYFFPSRLHRDPEQPITDKIVCLHMPVGHAWN
jgi:hypothetical protein